MAEPGLPERGQMKIKGPYDPLKPAWNMNRCCVVVLKYYFDINLLFKKYLNH
jgi:hypothetical protein